MAGVTFLAFGNGAPDVFSSIAAYSSGVGETGINELLGGAMFVSTVVVGCVAISSPVTVQRWPFSRDVCALVASLALLIVLAVHHHEDVSALLFLALYALYVSTVILPECVHRYRTNRVNAPAGVISNTSSLPLASGVMSAFWHALSPRVTERAKPVTSAKPYSFISRQDAEAATGKAGSYELGSPKPKPAAMFTNNVFEDHFEDLGASLSSPLISEEERLARGDDPAFDEASELMDFSNGGSILQGAYWGHLRWRWGLKRRLAQQFGQSESILQKIVFVPQVLMAVVRDLTIPLLDDEAWSRSIASVSPITVPLLFLFTSGYAQDTVSIEGKLVPFWLISLIYGAILGVMVSFTTHRSHPPTSFLYSFFFLLLSFASCVCWIYAVASELMALLIAVGYITHASNSLLGLTVLSWGNSIGDLITNVSVARAGFPQMAIGGCYGGPVFNILVGLGVPMAYAFVRGNDFMLSMDVHAWISLGFLFTSLCTSFIVFQRHRFRCPPWYGQVLLVYYLVYTTVNVAIALHVFLTTAP